MKIGLCISLEITAMVTNELTNERTNIHARSQYLLAEVTIKMLQNRLIFDKVYEMWCLSFFGPPGMCRYRLTWTTHPHTYTTEWPLMDSSHDSH